MYECGEMRGCVCGAAIDLKGDSRGEICLQIVGPSSSSSAKGNNNHGRICPLPRLISITGIPTETFLDPPTLDLAALAWAHRTGINKMAKFCIAIVFRIRPSFFSCIVFPLAVWQLEIFLYTVYDSGSSYFQ